MGLAERDGCIDDGLSVACLDPFGVAFGGTFFECAKSRASLYRRCILLALFDSSSHRHLPANAFDTSGVASGRQVAVGFDRDSFARIGIVSGIRSLHTHWLDAAWEEIVSVSCAIKS